MVSLFLFLACTLVSLLLILFVLCSLRREQTGNGDITVCKNAHFCDICYLTSFHHHKKIVQNFWYHEINAYFTSFLLRLGLVIWVVKHRRLFHPPLSHSIVLLLSGWDRWKLRVQLKVTSRNCCSGESIKSQMIICGILLDRYRALTTCDRGFFIFYLK